MVAPILQTEGYAAGRGPPCQEWLRQRHKGKLLVLVLVLIGSILRIAFIESLDNDILSLSTSLSWQGVDAVDAPVKNNVTGASRNQKRTHPPQLIIKVADLPDASQWKSTEETSYEVCFVTSVFAPTVKQGDHPPDVHDMVDENPTFRFYAFTNLPDLVAPGWTIEVLSNEKGGTVNMTGSPFQRYITYSRWPKFMGWQHPTIQRCQAVFYMDGFCRPKAKHAQRYQRLAKAIHDSELGFFQNRHELGDSIGILDELDRIVKKHKDVPHNVQASKDWFLTQPDFRPDALLYANHYLGYNPKSEHWQKASQTFWDRYSLEVDSWRDQPLWSYVLDKYEYYPPRLGTFEALFQDSFRNMAKQGHTYNEQADRNALDESTKED